MYFFLCNSVCLDFAVLVPRRCKQRWPTSTTPHWHHAWWRQRCQSRRGAQQSLDHTNTHSKSWPISNQFVKGYMQQTNKPKKLKKQHLAMDMFMKAATNKHPPSMFRWGVMYEDGLPGNTPDTQKALYWYSQAADVGHPGAQNNVGLMYEHGVGVQPNFEQAAVWCAVVLAILFFFQFLSFCEFFFEVLLKLDF